MRDEILQLNSHADFLILLARSGLVSAFLLAERFGSAVFEIEPVLRIKFVGSLIAVMSIGSNWRVFVGIRKSLVACDRYFDFTGLRIGRSDDFIAPMRALLLAYALYVFYQIESQSMSLFGSGTFADVMVDFSMQAALFLLVLWQFVTIRRLATIRYREQNLKLGRFLRKFDEALEKQKLKMSDLFASTFVLPIASLSPKGIALAFG